MFHGAVSAGKSHNSSASSNAATPQERFRYEDEPAFVKSTPRAHEAENQHRDKLLGNAAHCPYAKSGQMAKGGGKDKARKRHDREEAHRAKLAAKEQRRAAKASMKKDPP